MGKVLENGNCLKKEQVTKHLKNAKQQNQRNLAFYVRARREGAPVYILWWPIRVTMHCIKGH